MTVYRTIQIRNSITSNDSSNTLPKLLPGELAFTQSGNNLFIGAPDGTSGNIRIAHQIVSNGTIIPGEAIVSNSTGGINNLIIANLDSTVINSSNINTNNLYSNNIFANQAFFNSIGANGVVTGNTVISSNGVVTGNTALTSNGVTTGNSSINTTINSTSISIGNTTINSSFFTGTANNALYLGNVSATSYATKYTNNNITGIYTYSSNVYVNDTIIANSIAVNNFTITGSFFANSTTGASGTVLTSNGSGGYYWSTVSGGGSGSGTVTFGIFDGGTPFPSETDGPILDAGGVN
jgi:hypothetical protein